jgi:hypothetical protein
MAARLSDLLSRTTLCGKNPRLATEPFSGEPKDRLFSSVGAAIGASEVHPLLVAHSITAAAYRAMNTNSISTGVVNAASRQFRGPLTGGCNAVAVAGPAPARLLWAKLSVNAVGRPCAGRGAGADHAFDAPADY